jgi:peroxiredoxin Q/BCP
MRRLIAITCAGLLGLYACHERSSGTSASASLAVGSPAPAVSMTLHDGRVVRLEALRGHNVLVYFYPKDDTPG